MYARVARHQGDPMRDVSPAPLVELEGVAGLMMLIDRRSGKGLGVVVFDSEEAMRRGDAAINEYGPGTAGETTSVEFYEVAVQNVIRDQ